MNSEEGQGATSGAAQGAGTGALIGSVVPGIGTGVGAVAGGVIGGIAGFAGGAGASSARKAAQRAAEAQIEEQRRRREAIISQGKRLESLAEATPTELMAQESALNAGETQLNQQARLVAALDPALLEASNQALSILKGNSAASLNPAIESRNRARTQLVNNLRQRMGPGAESTPAGIKALDAFDLQTANFLSGANQQKFGELTGFIGNLGYGAPDLTARGGNLLNTAGYFTERKMNAGRSLLNALSGAPSVDVGGAFIGDAMKGKYQAQSSQDLMQGLGSLAFAYGNSQKQPPNFFTKDIGAVA